MGPDSWRSFRGAWGAWLRAPWCEYREPGARRRAETPRGYLAAAAGRHEGGWALVLVLSLPGVLQLPQGPLPSPITTATLAMNLAAWPARLRVLSLGRHPVTLGVLLVCPGQRMDGVREMGVLLWL